MDLWPYLVSTRIAADVAVLVFFKGTLIVVGLALAVRLLRSRSAAIRHRVWVCGLVALGILPFVSSVTPQWTVKTLTYPTETMLVGLGALETAPVEADGLAEASTANPSSATSLPVESVLLLIWWAGVLVVLTGIVSSFIRAQLMRRQCQRLTEDHALVRMLDRERLRLGITKRVGLLVSPEPNLAATIGSFRPEVIVGQNVAQMSTDELRPLFIHELAHVKRRDYLTHVLSLIALPIYWPNPLVWLARRHTALEREQACDDEVLNGGVASPAYAHLLLRFASSGSRLSTADSIVLQLRFSSTKNRIGSILDGRLDRRPVSVFAGAVLVVGMLGFSLPMASLDVLTSVPGTGSTEDLVLALESGDPAVRVRAARTLGRRGASTVRVELEAALDDPEPSVRLAAIGALVQLADPASVPAMARVLARPFDDGKGEHGFVLKYAMISLGKIGTRDAMRVLEKQLQRPVAPLRWLALETIHSMPGGGKVAWPYLKRFAESDPCERNRRLAHDILTDH